jgi:hypothetical protein
MIYASLIDDLLQPNMAYYAMRQAFEPVLVSIDTGNWIDVWVVNDSGADVEGTLTVRQMDGDGVETEQQVQVQVSAPQGKSVLATQCREFHQFTNKQPIVAELHDADGELINRSLEFPCPDRHNWFPQARIDVEIEGDTLVLTTDLLAHWVELKGDGLGWRFEDNYFELVPGQEKRVRLLDGRRPGTVTARSVYSPNVTEVTIGRDGPSC